MKIVWQLGRGPARFGMALVAVFFCVGSSPGGILPVSRPAPAGVSVVSDVEVAQVDSVTVTPYRWSASKSDNGAVIIKGYVPDAGIRARLFAGAGSYVIDASSLGLGQPFGFAEDAVTALAVLQMLTNGEAELTGTHWRLGGSVSDPETAEKVRDVIDTAGLADKGWLLELALPAKTADAATTPTPADTPTATAEADAAAAPVANPAPFPDETNLPESGAQTPKPIAPPPAIPFSFAVLKQGDNWIVGGNAPVAEFQAYLDAHFGFRSAGQLRVVPAPDGFAATALAGLAGLKTLDGGRLYFDGAHWHLSGLAANETVAKSAEDELGASGIEVEIAIAAPPPKPVADPFRFSAEKHADGAIDFNGFVSAEALKSYLAVRGGGGSDATVVASGAPADFAGDVLAALDALAGLTEGQAMFDGVHWSLSGPVDSDAAKSAVVAGLGPRAEDWTVALVAPEPVAEKKVAPPPPPIADPFRFSAEKRAGGAIDFDGFVPAETMKSYLIVRGGGGTDLTVVASGAPADFVGDVVVALDALSGLTAGSVASFDGASWSLSGAAESAAAKTAALNELGRRADLWEIAIAAPDPPPPEPVFDKGDADYVFVADKTVDAGMVLAGDVPAEAMRAYLGVIAGTDSSVEGLAVRTGAPQDFALAATVAVRALAGLDSGRLEYGDFAWKFNGKSASEPARAAAQSALAALPRSGDWTVGIVAPTPLEICSVEVAAFDTRNAILFDPGSSHIAKPSLPALDEIAGYLKHCPQAIVHIEGHTDADGDEESNLILSVSRAEAVADELVALGIGEERLYVIGYGESLPVASNDTSDGKRHNRRIVFSVLDGTE